MPTYLLKKLLFTMITVIGVISLVFFLIHLIPGDPIEIMLGETAQAADILKLRKELGLDKPIVKQYIDYYGDSYFNIFSEDLQVLIPDKNKSEKYRTKELCAKILEKIQQR